MCLLILPLKSQGVILLLDQRYATFVLPGSKANPYSKGNTCTTSQHTRYSVRGFTDVVRSISSQPFRQSASSNSKICTSSLLLPQAFCIASAVPDRQVINTLRKHYTNSEHYGKSMNSFCIVYTQRQTSSVYQSD